MSQPADLCMFVEGGYPYMLGGVSSWLDALIRSFPERRFHIVAMCMSTQPRVAKFTLPANVVGVTDVLLDRGPRGRSPTRADAPVIAAMAEMMFDVLTNDDGDRFAQLVDELQRSGLGYEALLDSRLAWLAMERAYEKLLPTAPLVDFFWTWRFLANSVLAIAAAPIPEAKVYHAVATGYAGLMAARARHHTGRPLIITEHGIYTNERRIEISVADWIFDSGASGFGVIDRAPQLRDMWLDAFVGFSRIGYKTADVITTQYRTNQLFQMQDGAPEDKLRLIPNGIDITQFADIVESGEPRRPTALLVGRVVPIKDIRTFVLAAGVLRSLVPDVDVIIIGPEDEDPAYAAEMRALVEQQGLQSTVRFLGRVPSVKAFFSVVDVIVLTSISEAQPIALLEAGAAGLPAVTTDVGSCREIIEGREDEAVKGPAGIVVPACDPQATAEAIARILLDPQMRRQMGGVMRERVATVFNEIRISRMYEELYCSLETAVPEIRSRARSLARSTR